MDAAAEYDSAFEAAKRKFHARKGRVTQTQNILTRALRDVKSQDSWTQFSEDQIRAKLVNMEEQLRMLEELAETLQDLLSRAKADDNSDPNAMIEDVWNQYTEYAESCEKTGNEASTIIYNLKKAGAPRPTPAQSGGAGSSSTKERYKDNVSMKPDKLNPKDSVTQYRQWKRKMNAYVKSSGMEAFPLDIAQEYILSCVDDELNKRVMKRISDHLPIYSSGMRKGLLDIIEEEFMREYPLITRRQRLFTIQQEENETFADLFARLIAYGEDAVHEDITPDKLMSMLLLISIRDKKLREHLQLQRTDDLERLRECGLAYQDIIVTNRKLSTSTASSSHVYPKTGKGGGGGNKGGSGRNGSNGRGRPRGPRVRDGKCTACGREGGCREMKQGCKAKDHQCKCGITGHFEKCCYRKDRWPKGAHATSTDRDRHDDDSETSGDSGGDDE